MYKLTNKSNKSSIPTLSHSCIFTLLNPLVIISPCLPLKRAAKFFINTLEAFLARQLPVSNMAKPACLAAGRPWGFTPWDHRDVPYV